MTLRDQLPTPEFDAKTGALLKRPGEKNKTYHARVNAEVNKLSQHPTENDTAFADRKARARTRLIAPLPKNQQDNQDEDEANQQSNQKNKQGDQEVSADNEPVEFKPTFSQLEGREQAQLLKREGTYSVLEPLVRATDALSSVAAGVFIGTTEIIPMLDAPTQIATWLQDMVNMAGPIFDGLPLFATISGSVKAALALSKMVENPLSKYAFGKGLIELIGSGAQIFSASTFIGSAMVVGSPALAYVALGLAVSYGAQLITSSIELHQFRMRYNTLKKNGYDAEGKFDLSYLTDEEEAELKTAELEYTAARRKMLTNLLGFIGWGLIGTVSLAAALSPAAPALLIAGSACLAAMALVATANFVFAAYNKKAYSHPFFPKPNRFDTEENAVAEKAAAEATPHLTLA